MKSTSDFEKQLQDIIAMDFSKTKGGTPKGYVAISNLQREILEHLAIYGNNSTRSLCNIIIKSYKVMKGEL